MAAPNWSPHPYQQRGMELLRWGDGALLLDPGMGKTATALGAFTVIRHAEGPDMRMLIVAPIKPMYDTWPRECLKWRDFEGLRCKVLHGKGKEQRLKESCEYSYETGWDHDILLINPEGLMWYLDNTEEQDRPQILCIDESTKFKNSQSKRFKALRKALKSHESFTTRWILTGTVVPNGLMDLWAQMYIVDKGQSLFEYVTHYKNRWFYSGGFGGYDTTPKDGALEEICAAVAHQVLRLNAEDHLDMPDLRNVMVKFQLPPLAQELYNKVQADFFNEMSHGTIIAANAAAAGTKCRQIANGACYVEEGGWRNIHEGKMQVLDGLLEEIGPQPTLVIYEFSHDKERLMEYLGDRAECITGVSGRKLESTVSKFNEGKLNYLVAHAGSLHGMNIQGACHNMIWYCIPWNLENYQQAVWRLYRQGQQQDTVHCYHIVAEDTLDETVVNVLASKTATQDAVHSLLLGE